MGATQQLMPPGWLQPQWPAPGQVRAVCTTRAGGVSRPPYEGFNLGDHVGDEPVAVQANRRQLAQSLGVRPVYLQQVHGSEVLHLQAQQPDGQAADACVLQQRGLAATIMVADCLPVLFSSSCGRIVGAAHAGWRGLAHGVLENTVTAMRASLQQLPLSRDSSLLAWLGPCIGPQAFEVGAEVRAAFLDQDAGCDAAFKALGAGKFLADLPALARRRLQAQGVTALYGNDGSPDWCTVGNPSRFFSHRRDRVSGRFAACIWLD